MDQNIHKSYEEYVIGENFSTFTQRVAERSTLGSLSSGSNGSFGHALAGQAQEIEMATGNMNNSFNYGHQQNFMDISIPSFNTHLL